MKILKQRLPNVLYPEMRDYNEKALLNFPLYAEYKLDGELNVFSNGFLANKGGKARCDFPVTDALTAEFGYETDLWGELHWCHGFNGDLYNLLSNAKSDDLNYTIFDISRYKGTDVSKLSYVARRELLLEVLPSISNVHITMTEYVQNKTELEQFMDIATHGSTGNN